MAKDAGKDETTGRGWRGSPDLWLDAAHDLLVEGGVEAVKIGALASRLKLSRTSFYWHFADREALLAALLERWRMRNTEVLVTRLTAPAASVTEAVYTLIDAWLDPGLFDSRAEFAMRTWSLSDPTVARALAEEDACRVTALTGMFCRFGYPQAEADTRARTIYLTQVGYITLRQDEDLATRLARIPAYVLTFTGRLPPDSETAAFFARHKA